MATIKDIAKKAGISPSTASRALNDNSRISRETIARVKKIAAEMGYRPNFAARNLTRGDANMVGLIFPVTSDQAPANPFHIDLMRGISSALTPLHYEMVVAISPTKEELLTSIKSMVTQADIHNFLVFYTQENDPVTAYLRKKGLNFVVIGKPESNSSDRFVDNDNIAAGQEAARCLINNYHAKHPLFIHSGEAWPYEISRLEGYQYFLKEKKIISQVWDDSSNQSLQEFMEQHPEIDGIVCADDILFAKVSNILLKYHSPIICFNNSRLIGMILGNDTKIDMRPRELGKQAVDVLFNPQEHSKIINFKVTN